MPWAAGPQSSQATTCTVASPTLQPTWGVSGSQTPGWGSSEQPWDWTGSCPQVPGSATGLLQAPSCSDPGGSLTVRWVGVSMVLLVVGSSTPCHRRHQYSRQTTSTPSSCPGCCVPGANCWDSLSLSHPFPPQTEIEKAAGQS